MPVNTLLKEDWPVAEAFREEYQELRAWAGESRTIYPFMDLAIQWGAGLLTIAEGRRIETDYQLWLLYGGLG